MERLENSVIKEVRINYVLATPDNWERVELACTELGWSKATILKQMLHGFMATDGDFYARAGILDADARGMTEEDYFRTLRDEDESKLSRYLAGRPAFGKAPIDDIEPIESAEENRHRYNVIGLSAYNFVLLKVAQIVDTGPLVQVVSRMLVKHLEDKWDERYQFQIDRDKACKFILKGK